MTRFSVFPLLVYVSAAGAAQSVPAGVSAASLLQMLLALAVVLAAIVGVFWLLRRFVPGQAGAGGVVRVVGGVMVGPRERLVVVEVEDTWLLLGVGGGQVNTLHVMPRPANLPPAAAPAAAMGVFAQWLSKAQGKRHA